MEKTLRLQNLNHWHPEATFFSNWKSDKRDKMNGAQTVNSTAMPHSKKINSSIFVSYYFPAKNIWMYHWATWWILNAGHSDKFVQLREVESFQQITSNRCFPTQCCNTFHWEQILYSERLKETTFLLNNIHKGRRITFFMVATYFGHTEWQQYHQCDSYEMQQLSYFRSYPRPQMSLFVFKT